jgi:hypothetical protein
MHRASRWVYTALTLLVLSSLVFTTGPATAVASSLTPKHRMVGWRGDRLNGRVPHPSKCRFGAGAAQTCGSFYFSVNISKKYWSSQRGSLGVRIHWPAPDDDFDLYLLRAGKLIKSSRRRGTTTESVSLRNPAPGTYRAIVVPVRVTDSAYGGYARLKVSPSPPTTPYYPAPLSIRSDCSRDVTADLLRWIASVPDNSTLTFNRGGCYRIDGSLRIQDRWGLTFQGNGARFKAGTDGDVARRHFWFLGGGNLAIRNLVVVGANPHAGAKKEAWREDRAFQHAFAFHGVQGAVLDNVRAYDVYGDFVLVRYDERSRDRPWSRGITVQNSTFERNGRQGIAISAGENVTLRWNYVGDVSLTTFDIEPLPDAGARGVRIFNNVTGRGRHLWLANGGFGFDVSDVHVIRNFMIFRTDLWLIAVVTPPGGLRGPYHFADNNFLVRGSGKPAFQLDRAWGVTIGNNDLLFPARMQMTAVALQGSEGVRVIGNRFRGAARVLDADRDSRDYHQSNNET